MKLLEILPWDMLRIDELSGTDIGMGTNIHSDAELLAKYIWRFRWWGNIYNAEECVWMCNVFCALIRSMCYQITIFSTRMN